MEKNIYEYVKEAGALMASSEILGAQAARAQALAAKLEDRSITISVIGQFKRGKSCLVNALLGEDVLPTGIVPITSAAVKVRYGQPSCSVKFSNGVVKTLPAGDLENYVSEQKNPCNLLGVASVEMALLSPFLKDGLTLVDTPGIGSYHKNNTDTAYSFIKESDAVVFMLSVDSPINEIEIDILKNTREHAAKFFFAVNKVDTIDGEDRNTYINYCRNLLNLLMGTDDAVIFPISARTGFGVPELKDALSSDLREKLRDILEKSAQLKLKDIISSALSQIELYWKVLLMPPAGLKGSLSDMERALADFRGSAAETVHGMEADRNIIIPGLEEKFKIKLNEFTIALSGRVTEIFGMDYHYEIPLLEAGSGPGDSYRPACDIGSEYLAETGRLCDDLGRSLSEVIMYRNNNAADVVGRIYTLNTLTRTLKRIYRILDGSDEENPAPRNHPVEMTNLCP